MNEVMTVEEIDAKFASEWVLIGDLETDDQLEILRGTVLWHDKDRGLVYEKATELQPGRFTVHDAGTFPDDPHFSARFLFGFNWPDEST